MVTETADRDLIQMFQLHTILERQRLRVQDHDRHTCHHENNGNPLHTHGGREGEREEGGKEGESRGRERGREGDKCMHTPTNTLSRYVPFHLSG